MACCRRLELLAAVNQPCSALQGEQAGKISLSMRPLQVHAVRVAVGTTVRPSTHLLRLPHVGRPLAQMPTAGTVLETSSQWPSRSNTVRRR
jgi:hypothetical protein